MLANMALTFTPYVIMTCIYDVEYDFLSLFSKGIVFDNVKVSNYLLLTIKIK